MKHEHALPYLAALGTFVVVALTGLLGGGLDSAYQQLSLRASEAQYAEQVILGSHSTIVSLKRTATPTCTEENLRELRRLEYVTSTISDIAVVGSDNKVACTTTLGILAEPQPALEPEYSIFSQGERIFVTNRGSDYIGRAGRITTRSRLGQFQVTVDQDAIERLRSFNFSAVGFISEGGSLRFIRGDFKEKGLQADIEEIEARKADWSKSFRGFSWPHLALEASFRINGAPYVYYQREALLAPTATSLTFKGMLALASFALAMAAHAATVAWLGRRREMPARIKGLLTPENLRCVYQPLIDLQSGRIVGCEVLVRLQDGETLLTPDRFLPAVVERELTWRLDQLVVERSITDLQLRLPKGESFEIALNLFPQNIKAKQLHELIHDKLGWRPSSEFTINLEVIEHAYQEDMLAEIAALKRMGYRVCVDDFGTGYSNLGSIKKFRPDFLKIDRSFVHEMESASVRSSLIPEIVAIARATGAALIAEGIENEAQLNALRTLGVEFGQGYFLGRPMSLEALMARLDE